MPIQPWQSPNGQRFTLHRDAVPTVEPFFKRLHELYPNYQSLGGYAHRPMRTLDGRELGGLSTHATGFTLDVKAPDAILRQMAQEFPNARWGGNFKKHYDPVHFEFGQNAPPIAPPVQPQAQQAQPTPQQAPPMADQREPTFLENLQGRMANPLFQQGLGLFLSASQGGDLNQGMNAGSERAASMRKGMMEDMALREQQQQKAAIAQMLQNPQSFGNIPPALIDIGRVTKNLGPIQDYIIKSQTAGQTDDIKEFQYAVQGGFKGTFPDWMARKKEQQGEYAKQLVYGTDAAGNIVPMQAGSKGNLVRSAMPDGVTMQRDPLKFDAGTHHVLMDPTTRQVIGSVPKNISEVESQKQQGDAKGKAIADLPAVMSNSQNIINYIDSVANDPYLDNMVGWRGYTPNVTPQAKALQAKIDQLSGQGFLIAFQNLKGAGAITDVEGAKATAALGRFQQMVQSGEDYRAALKDFRGEVQRLVALARQKAGAPGAQPPGTPAAAKPAKNMSDDELMRAISGQ